MKKLFRAIRNRDLETVHYIIDNRPELVNCRAKQPPKKDDGQSPLQIALKTGNTAIAEYLLDMGQTLILLRMSHVVISGECLSYIMQSTVRLC